MKDNGYYKIEDTPEGGKKITLLKGCIVDYDIFITEIFGSTFIQQKYIDIESPKKTWLDKDNLIKVSKKTTIEIKTIQTGYKKNS